MEMVERKHEGMVLTRAEDETFFRIFLTNN
jgi:hypothetical protein